MQWRELECEVHHTTVLRRMQAWRASGVFHSAYTALLKTYKKLHPTQYYCVDSAYVKNMFSSRCVGRNHTDRGRKALKLSALVDQYGMPHTLCCHPGNRPDVVLLDDTLRGCFLALDHLSLYADRGYDSKRNRTLCSEHGLHDRIFRRRCKTTKRTNAKRIVVEHTFAWMKQFRRLLYLYEHSEHQFLAFTLLAFGNMMSKRASEC
jgi:IS5 family transposase